MSPPPPLYSRRPPHAHAPRPPPHAQPHQLPPTPPGSGYSNSQTSISSQLAEGNRIVRRHTNVPTTMSRTQGAGTTPNPPSHRAPEQRQSGAYFDRSASKIPGPCISPRTSHARQSMSVASKTVKISDFERGKVLDRAPSVVPAQSLDERLSELIAIDSPQQQAQHQSQPAPSKLPRNVEPENQPRRVYVRGREPAKSHPVLRYRPPAVSGEIVTGETREIGAENTHYQAGQDVLSPMYFTMMYKNSRSDKRLAVNPVNDNLEAQGSSESLRGREARYSNLVICEEETESQHLIKDENQNHYPPTDYAEDYFPGQGVANQGIQEGIRSSIDQSEPLYSINQHNSQSSSKFSPHCLPKKQTNQTGLPSKVLPSEVPRRFSGSLNKAASRAAAKETSGSEKKELKQRISAGRLNIRSFSWGIGPKSSNRKEPGTDRKGGNIISDMDKPGTVLDRVRKFEALGSKGGPDTRSGRQKSNSPRLTTTATIPSSEPKPPSSLRLYFQGKGKEYPQKRTESRNTGHKPPGREALPAKRNGNSGNLEKGSLKLQRSFSLAGSSGLDVHQPSKMAGSRVNPEEVYKYQNPDGGRFPAWSRAKLGSVIPRSPSNRVALNQVDSRRRKTDSTFYVRFIPTPPRFKEQNGNHIPAQQSSDITSSSKMTESSPSSRCNMPYWCGRYSAIRDIMRQETLDISAVRATADYEFFEESETGFMEAVFCRLINNVCQQMDVEKYTEDEIMYLGYFKQTIFRRMELQARNLS